MLDNTTKRRIDSARDILVGKVPDPKSQVEQITIALIYKFMDDMDNESEELGGERTFFKGDFEKYAWHKIFDPQHGGFDMISLYAEAIDKMDINPNVPQLFRDIFKNAYLPYRDPETLRSFLKEINKFEYEHSERLGDAFEYLLSVMSSQGDAGQFRTPRHIIDFMVDVIDPQKNESIMDPACGTAGFLISSYKHILKNNSSNFDPETEEKLYANQHASATETVVNGKQYRGDKLTPDDKVRLAKNIIGYDISPDMVRLSLVNMYLHGITEPYISEYDTLTSEDKWNEYVDVILANPPFMSPKGGIKPHSKFSIQSKRSEVLFVDYMADHLTPNGRTMVIVPEGVIFQAGTAYKSLRKKLVDENYLVGVISLPSGIFNPYSGVKTSILWFDRSLAKKTDKILFLKVENDGFDLGAQRRPIKLNDLPQIADTIKAYKLALIEDKEFSLEEDKGLLVEKTKLAEDGEYNLNGEKYNISDNSITSIYETVCLEEVCEFKRGPFGGSLKKDMFVENGYAVYEQSHAINNDFSKVRYFISEEKFESMKSFELFSNDLIMSCSGTMGKIAIVPSNIKRGIINQALLKLTPKENISSKYLKYILQSDAFQYALSSTTMGVAIKNVASVKILKKIQIPLPSKIIQEEIIAEIESYQKIIDGALQIVNNYKPTVNIDPEWEMVELGDVAQLTPKKSELKEVPFGTDVSFVPMADLNENQIGFVPKQVKTLEEVIKGYTYFRNEDVLLARVTPCFENGKAGIARNLVNETGFGSSEYFVLRPSERILPEWIYIFVTSNHFRAGGKLKMTGTGGLQRVPKDFVSNYLIPIPSIDIQKEHINKIAEENAIVDQNKRLIEIFEQKITEKINSIWGK